MDIDVRFSPIGSKEMTWIFSFVFPAIRCDHPGTPHGGDIDGDLSFGGEVTFSCRSGFRLDGPTSIRCQADRTWSEGIPQCISE